MSTSELVPRTVDGEDGLCKRQKLGISIDGELLSSLINDINAVSRIRLKQWFPVLAVAHETNDWSLQLKCFDPNLNGSKWDIEEAFSSSEFVALCVWLLFTKHSKINKNDVLEALQIVKSSFSKDPYMSNDLQPDKMIEEDLVVDVLCLDSREVQKQVCCALAFSVSCNRDTEITFGDAIQYKLIQLVRNPKSQDSNVICALRTIAYIAAYETGMEEKIIETEINKFWLAKIMMKTENESILVEACWILKFVVSGKRNEMFWRHTVNAFLPGLIRWSHTRDKFLMRAALCAITSITSGASSKQIEYVNRLVIIFLVPFFLADFCRMFPFPPACPISATCCSVVWLVVRHLVKRGCLKGLFDFAVGLLDSLSFEFFLDGLRNILNADEDEDEDEDDYDERRNKYAKMIDGFVVGWALLTYEGEFCNDAIAYKAQELLRDYAPMYLGKCW